MFLSYSGDYKNAVRAFKLVQKAGYDSDVVAYNLAVASVRQQPHNSVHSSSMSKARKKLEELLATAPEDLEQSAALYGLTGLAALRGEDTAALEGLRKAVQKSRNVVEWAMHDAAWHDIRDNLDFQSILDD